VVTVIAIIITSLFLPETNQHMGETKAGALFDFGKLFHAITDANVGPTLLITLFHSLAFSMFIYAFQPFSVKILHLSANQISLIFTVFGLLGLISQMGILPYTSKKFPLKKTYSTAIAIVAATFVGLFFSHAFIPFIVVSAILALANGLIQPLTQAILSRETDEASQGTMQGFNASYMSIGQIIGPIVGGALTVFGIPVPFLAGSFSILICVYLSMQVLHPGVSKEDTF
jgi:MFS family permease